MPWLLLQIPQPDPPICAIGGATLVQAQGGPALSLLPHPRDVGGWWGASRLTVLPPPGRWGARENCGCVYRLRVRLLDVYENEVVKFSASPNPVLQWTEPGCRQVGPERLPDCPRPAQGCTPPLTLLRGGPRLSSRTPNHL